jgi:ABC-type transport system involved in cytochrome c biogenesis permease subunit
MFHFIDPIYFTAFWIIYGVVVLAVIGFGWPRGWGRIQWLRTWSLLVAVAILGMTYKIFEPMLVAGSSVPAPQEKIQLPAYDYHPWHAFPVQVDGRVKPLETAAIEAVWHITGRSKFEGQDPVAIVLQWMLLHGTDPGKQARADLGDQAVDWEHYPFILCDHHDLRQRIYEGDQQDGQELTPEQLQGKYIAPADLRASSGFKQLLDKARAIRMRDPDKATQSMSPEERKAEEVYGRLELFDNITQSDPYQAGRMRHEDPLHLVALDKVPSGPWFSLGEIREVLAERHDLKDKGMTGESPKWSELMLDRLSRTPQLYISPQRQEALKQFQQEIKSGHGTKAIDELADIFKERSDQKIKQFEELHRAGDVNGAMQLFLEMVQTDVEKERVFKLIHGEAAKKEEGNQAIAQELRAILAERDQQTIEQLRHRVQSAMARGYHPDKQEFRMLHLNYLESRFPNLYRESAAWQEFPAEAAEQMVDSIEQVHDAYLSGDSSQFADASEAFFQKTAEVSRQFAGVYPGEDTTTARLVGLTTGRAVANPAESLLNMEMSLNRLQPFLWSWIIMLVSAACFLASAALHSRICFLLAFLTYLGGLGLEAYGFVGRMALAGRPPVSNMYETLIWVAFMSAVFALILELIYRRNLIGLAGALVSTLALVLAWQLPVELGAKINPITPVLRSNYWLTIHVLTIVSSYAGGTLAWGLGNLSLILLAFGHPSRDLLKLLSKYTYRAIQIAVLLLAAGTFLGGWWAAESWGRFWGWDPKEVWALIALVCYVIPLHARYIGWVKDFGLAVSAVICYAAIVMSWYGVNFVLAAGLHSYGFGSGGPWWAFWAGLLNVEWVLIASMMYYKKTTMAEAPAPEKAEMEAALA